MGDVVVICCLLGKPELNGRCGLRETFMAKAVCGFTEKCTPRFAVKPANLRVARQEEEDEMVG